MEPINQRERSRAILQFILLYGLSILIVMTISYFLFHAPATFFRGQLQRSQQEETELRGLSEKVTRMTGMLKNIAETDQKYISSTNSIEKGSLFSSLQEYEKNISDGLTEIKRDSQQLTSNLARTGSNQYIVAFNVLLAYRNTIASLQKALEEKGGDAGELVKAKSALDACGVQLEIYKQMAANNRPVAAPAPSGGGSSAREAQLQQQLEKSQADLAACQKARSASAAAPARTAGAQDEALKATALFEAGQDLFSKAANTRNLIERRGVLFSAKQLLERSKAGYNDADKIDKLLRQINAELSRLSNMG